LRWNKSRWHCREALLRAWIFHRGHIAQVPSRARHPPTGVFAVLPPGLSSSCFVGSEDPHRPRLGEQPLGVRNERTVHGRPRNVMCCGDLDDRAGGVADGQPDLNSQPAR